MVGRLSDWNLPFLTQRPRRSQQESIDVHAESSYEECDDDHDHGRACDDVLWVLDWD